MKTCQTCYLDEQGVCRECGYRSDAADEILVRYTLQEFQGGDLHACDTDAVLVWRKLDEGNLAVLVPYTGEMFPLPRFSGPREMKLLAEQLRSLAGEIERPPPRHRRMVRR